MRELKIREIDNNCYIISTVDFRNDEVSWHWASTPGHFFAEHKRTFARAYFKFSEYPTIGAVINAMFDWEQSRVDVFSTIAIVPNRLGISPDHI